MIVVCPGSFDPVTLGHLDIFRRAARQFDQVIVAVTGNPQKPSGWFSLERRVQLIEENLGDAPNITVEICSGLLAAWAKERGASALVKGLRSSQDFDHEMPQGVVNRHLSGVDTVYLITDPAYQFVSSSMAKEVAGLKASVDTLVPPNVAVALRDYVDEHST